MSLLEVFGVLFSAVGVWLTIRRNRLCWPISMICVALYTVIFWEAKLFASMALQCVYLLTQVYGWWSWSRQVGEVQVVRPTARPLLISIVIGVLLSGLIGYWLASSTEAQMPWMDSSLMAFSLVGSVWSARRYLTTWYLWIVVDIVYVGLFIHQELWLTAGLYTAFVGLATYGLLSWQREAPPLATTL